MTDTVTEFANVASLTHAQLLAGYNILSNSATETAVVKDVAVINAGNRRLSIAVGATEIASINATGTLSGTELVGASSSMLFKTLQAGLFNVFYSPTSVTSLYQHVVPTVYVGDLFQAPAPIVDTLMTLSTPSLLPMMYIFFDPSGNFYYGYQGNANLYKRTGGINGPETAIPFGGMGLCYDGVRYFYAFSTSAVYTYDTQTATASNVACAIPTIQSSYVNASALDGRIFLRANYSDAFNYWVTPTTGAWSQLTAPASGSAAYVSLMKDSAGNYIACQSDVGVVYWFNYGSNVASPLQQGSGNVLNPAFLGNFATGNKSQGIRAAGTSDLSRVYYSAASAVWVFNANDKTLISIPVTNTTYLGNFGLFVPQVDVARASADFGLVGLRATGIKTT